MYNFSEMGGLSIKVLWGGVVAIGITVLVALWLKPNNEDSLLIIKNTLEEIQNKNSLLPYTENITTLPLSEIASLEIKENLEQNPQSVKPEKPRLGLVLDDLGPNQIMTERILSLAGGPFTMAFLPYAKKEKLKQWTSEAHHQGHEIILHLPMQPENTAIDPGPNALRLDHKPYDIINRLQWAIGRVDHIAGINNHMGSAFTHWDEGMQIVMQEISGKNFYFMDSLTHPKSVVSKVAHRQNINVIVRDIFLDHELEIEKIRRQIRLFETIARKRGYAIAIAHPYPETWRILEEWIPDAIERGFVFVKISQLIDL